MTNLKGVFTKVMLVGLAAGAFIVASPTKAQAQGFAVGARVGSPAYGRRDGFEFERRQEFLRREAFLRRDEWLRAHRFHAPYGYR